MRTGSTPVSKLKLTSPAKEVLAPALLWHTEHFASFPMNKSLPDSARASTKVTLERSKSSGRPVVSMKASISSNSSSVGRRKCVPGVRAKSFVKCWITAPTEKRRRVPGMGAPSPDQPVRCSNARVEPSGRLPSASGSGGMIEVDSDRECGTPRIVNFRTGSSKPSTFSRMRPNSRRSSGISKLGTRFGCPSSATKIGWSLGKVSMKAGSTTRLFSTGWQVAQVRPLPVKVSRKKSSPPSKTSRLTSP